MCYAHPGLKIQHQDAGRRFTRSMCTSSTLRQTINEAPAETKGQDQGPGQGPGTRTGRAPGSQGDNQGQGPRTDGPTHGAKGPHQTYMVPHQCPWHDGESNIMVHPCKQHSMQCDQTAKVTRTYSIGRTSNSSNIIVGADVPCTPHGSTVRVTPQPSAIPYRSTLVEVRPSLQPMRWNTNVHPPDGLLPRRCGLTNQPRALALLSKLITSHDRVKTT